MKQLQGLVGPDAEGAAQGPGVVRVAVEDLGAAGSQSAAQVVEVGAEVGEVVEDGEWLVGRDEEAVRRGAVALLEDLRQRDGLVVAVVDEDPDQDRVGLPTRAQPDWTGRA